MTAQAPAFPQMIGECIYCGSHAGDLSDEHVIPFGLGGSWILQDASCPEHRDLTSALEADVLQHAWGAARAALGVRTRRKKRRSGGFDVRLEVRGVIKTVKVSVSDHPAPIAWPVYAPPGVTPENPKIPGTPVVRLRTSLRIAKARALGAQHGATAVRFTYPDPRRFARFLGKVAYGFAVACNGLPATRNAPLLRAVLADSPDIFKFVGNLDSPDELTADVEQEVVMGTNEQGRVVCIRLLGAVRAPEYVVRVDSPAG